MPAYLAACGLVLWLVGRQVGTELFPQVDSGQFVIRFRSPPGSEYELTRKCALKILEVIDAETQGKVAISMGYVGLGATNTATNNILLFMRGTDDGQLRVRLQGKSDIKIAELRERLRKALPEQVIPWLKGILMQEGCSPEEAESRAKQFSFGFEPGDIVSTVMSFGSPAPVEIIVAGPERDTVRSHALKVLDEMKKIPSLRDVQLYQQLDYPTVRVDIDRQKAGLSGVDVKDVTDALLVGTSSSRYVAKNYWRDPKSGVDYQVQVQVPQQRMNRPQQVETLPLAMANPDSNLMIRDVATVHTGTASGEIDRSSMQRYLSITANIEGDDLGRATTRIDRAIQAAGAAATRSARKRPRPGYAHDGDVPFPGHRLGPGGSGDSRVVDRLLPVVPAGADLDRRRAGRGLWRGRHAAVYGNYPEHRVLYGLDHVYRRLGFELGAADGLHGRPLEGRGIGSAGGRRRGQRSVAADSDDRGRHGVRHGAHGHGLGRRQRNGGAAGTGRDRRARGFDLCHAFNHTGHVRAGDGRLEKDFAVDRS